MDMGYFTKLLPLLHKQFLKETILHLTKVLFFVQDKRLRSGDQILRIGDTDLAGMNSEQVAQVRCPFASAPRRQPVRKVGISLD